MIRFTTRVVVFPLLIGVAVGSCTARDSQEQKTIRAAYERLSQYASNSGTTLEFQLSDFVAISRAEFSTIPLVDIATMPGGEMVDVLRSEQRYEDPSLSRVSFLANWNTGPDWLDVPENKQLSNISIANALDKAGTDQPELQNIIAITSYTVKVTLDRKSRSYTAAFLWLKPADQEGTAARRFIPVDHITQALAQAVVETLPPTNFSPSNPEALGTSQQELASYCTPQEWTPTVTQGAQDATNHIFGQHASSATFGFVCTCNSSCTSTCRANITSSSCSDTGLTVDSCHVTASNSQISVVGRSDGDQGGAACAGGFGCVVKSCFLCLCDLSVQVSVSGATVTFSSGGNPDWSENIQASWTCPSCSRTACTPCMFQECDYDYSCGQPVYCGSCQYGYCQGGHCPGGCVPEYGYCGGGAPCCNSYDWCDATDTCVPAGY